MKNTIFKSVLHKFNVIILIAVLASTFMTVETFVDPKAAQATCDPRGQFSTHVSPTVSISLPTGTYTDPSSLPVSMSGELAYFCEGPASGGAGYQNTATSVHYRIYNSEGTIMFSDVWRSDDCPNPLACWQEPYSFTNTVSNMSNWPQGTYTITADAYDDTQFDLGQNIFDTDSENFVIIRSGPDLNDAGSIVITSINPNPADSSVTVSGTGQGGMWQRQTINCPGDAPRRGYWTQRLLDASGDTANQPSQYHNHSNPHQTRYKIDGQDAGAYTLNQTDPGQNEVPQCGVEGGFQATTYSFSFNVDTTNLSEGNHTIYVDALDESTDVVIGYMASFTVTHPATPQFICSANESSVLLGDTATFLVRMTPTNGLTRPVNVVLDSSNPTGPSLVTSPVSLNQNNSYTNTASISTQNLTAGTTYQLVFRAYANGISQTCPATLTIQAGDLPSVDLKFAGSDGPVYLPSAPGSGNLTWRTIYATSCTGSMDSGADTSGWSGSRMVANGATRRFGVGDLAVTPPAYIFRLTCTNAYGSASDTVEVNVSTPPQQIDPTVTLQCQGVTPNYQSTGPCHIYSGGDAMLYWQSDNATSCSMNPNMGNISVTNLAGVSTGSLYAPGPYTYTITCNGDPGTNPAYSSVQIIIDPAPLASVSLKFNGVSGQISIPANPPSGASGDLSWDTVNAESCNGSMVTGADTSAWTSSHSVANFATAHWTVNGLQVGTYTFRLTCYNIENVPASSDVTVNVIQGPLPPDATMECLGESPITRGPGPCHITQGNSALLFWTSHNTKGCSMSPNIGGNPLPLNNNLGMSTGILNTPGDYAYTLTCVGNEEPPAISTVHIIVDAGQTPQLNFLCKGNQDSGFTTGPCTSSYGSTGTVRWIADFADSCNIDNGIGELVPPDFGTKITGALTQPSTTFTLTCYNAFGSSQASVVFIVNGGEPDFTFTCSQALVIIDQDSTGSYSLGTTSLNDFASPVSFSSSISPSRPVPPTISIAPGSQVPGNPTNYATAFVNVPSNGSLGTYTINFTATGGGKSHSYSCDLEVRPGVVPNKPVVRASNSVCDQIQISITPDTPPTPTRYELYRGQPNSGTLIHTFNAGDDLNYVDTVGAGAQQSNNYYYVIAYVGNLGSEPGVSNVANIIPCKADISNSDKDLVFVQGKFNKSFDPNICSTSSVQNNVTLPNNAIFTVGDIVTFEIHVCNNGNQATRDASNLTVTDLLYNPSNPSTQYTLKYPDNNPLPTGYAKYEPANCASMSSKTDTSINFNVPYVAINGICTIRFTAQIVKPENTDSSAYRFQNTGDITVQGFPELTTHYFTLPQIFSATGGIPNRNEVSPNGR